MPQQRRYPREKSGRSKDVTLGKRVAADKDATLVKRVAAAKALP